MPYRAVGQGLAVVVATSVLGVCAPAHADTSDGSTTLSRSLSSGGPAVPGATHKVGGRITGRLPSPTAEPSPAPVVQKVTGTVSKVTGRAHKVTGTIQDATGPVQDA